MVVLYFMHILTYLSVLPIVKAGLYSPTDDDVVILDVNSFEKLVLSSESAWIVEFYNSWCGHCINFAPTWKKLATDVKGWQPVINVGAIDCSSSENLPMCRKYDVKGFPTFKLFQFGAVEGDKGEEFQNQDFHALRMKMIDFVMQRTSYEKPKSWPKLEPLESIDGIWNEAGDHHDYVALVFEDEKSYLGRAVILDLCTEKRLLIRRMLSDSVKKYGITEFPSLYLIHRDGKFERLAAKETDRQAFVDVLRSLVKSSKDDLPKKGNLGEEKSQNYSDTDVKYIQINQSAYSSQTVQMADLVSALHYSFRQEIAIHKSVSGPAFEALKKFIRVLAKYFPGREHVRNFIWRVSTWLNSLLEISGEGWLEKIDSFQTEDTFLPDKIQWTACRGSEIRYRGYPCGLWTLFHTLTVSFFDTTRGPSTDPLEVLDAIQGYMKFFFGCQECSKNFLKMAANIRSVVKSSEDSILWLWRAHNQANQRLHGDVSEDPSHPKIQFPSHSMCHTCQSSNVTGPKGEIIWNAVEVKQFLLRFYDSDKILETAENVPWKKDVHSSEKNEKNLQLDWWERQQRKADLEKIRELRQFKSDKKESKKVDQNESEDSRVNKTLDYAVANFEIVNKRENNFKAATKKERAPSGWGFNNIDFSICLMFYVMCTFILMVLYYHFIVQRRYRPCNLLPF